MRSLLPLWSTRGARAGGGGGGLERHSGARPASVNGPARALQSPLTEGRAPAMAMAEGELPGGRGGDMPAAEDPGRRWGLCLSLLPWKPAW